MSLGNAHIEATLRHLLHHYRHRAARRHSGCYTYHSIVQLGKVEECLAKDILHTRRFGLALYALTCLGVEASRSVPNRQIALGRGVTIALLRDDVEEFWRVNALECDECTHQSLYVVAIHTTEVAESETLEEVAIL